jgi:3-oxoacyl-[acyl-carrier-protein] synthase-3
VSAFKIEQVRIAGIAACVPKTKRENIDNPVFLPNSGESFIKMTGVSEVRIADKSICTSDLCYAAAEKLLKELKWDRAEVDVIVFVSQTPDYLLPVTSATLQNKLGLSTGCLAIDIPLGCSGYVYGIMNIASMMSAGKLRKGLLCVGDTLSKITSVKDKSTQPLFGDGSAVTAFEYSEKAAPMLFDMGTDGSGYRAIIVPDGGARSPFNQESLLMKQTADGIERNSCQLELDGMDVFSFGVSQAPKTVNSLLTHFILDKDDVDYFVFHQANRMMNEIVAKKLKLPAAKVPYSLKKFGNTSSATIPLTMVSELRETCINASPTKWIFCGFGVGLSWGTVYAETANLVCPEIIEI